MYTNLNKTWNQSRISTGQANENALTKQCQGITHEGMYNSLQILNPSRKEKKNSTMTIEQKLFRYRNANSLDLENIQDIKKHTRNRQKVSWLIVKTKYNTPEVTLRCQQNKGRKYLKNNNLIHDSFKQLQSFIT
jgi:hypothetical protein